MTNAVIHVGCCSPSAASFLQTMKMYKWPALRLALVPGLAEALFDAGVACAVFRMPFTLALSLGFILKAVGPGLVVPAMFQLQKQGLGVNKGIPSTVVIAASFDDIVAITGFSIFISIAIATGDNAAWQIASGPLQVMDRGLADPDAAVHLKCSNSFLSRQSVDDRLGHALLHLEAVMADV